MIRRLEPLQHLVLELIDSEKRSAVSSVRQIHAKAKLQDFRAILAGMAGHDQPAPANALEAHPAGQGAAAFTEIVDERPGLFGKVWYDQIGERAPDHRIFAMTADGLRGAGDIGDRSCEIGLDQEIATGEGETDEAITLQAEDVTLGGHGHGSDAQTFLYEYGDDHRRRSSGRFSA